jgi:cephalosporin hydroxylase
MKLSIDTDARQLTVETDGVAKELPLYGREAFELVSDQWVRIGWGVGYYFTMTWFGRLIQQLPEDLVRIQEVLAALQPDVIIETGIYYGGSLLFHATICEGLGKGRVIGIDQHIHEDTRIALNSNRLAHRITAIQGDSASPEIVEQVRSTIRPDEKVLVILDSDHSRQHVARELKAWAPLVTPGSCIVVTDGIMRDLTDVPGGDASWAYDNPCTAASEFRAEHPEFELRQPAWPFNRSTLQKNITYWPDAWLWKKPWRKI